MIVEQYRYGIFNPDENVDLETLKTNLITSGSAVKIRIQGIPGTKFHLSEENENNDTTLYIGFSGIFELDIDGIASISKLYFEESSLKNYKTNGSTSLIIDIAKKGV